MGEELDLVLGCDPRDKFRPSSAGSTPAGGDGASPAVLALAPKKPPALVVQKASPSHRVWTTKVLPQGRH